MAKINKYWGYVAIGALTAAAAGAVAALIAKKGSCKEDFDFEDDFDDFDLTDEKETAKEDQSASIYRGQIKHQSASQIILSDRIGLLSTYLC